MSFQHVQYDASDTWEIVHNQFTMAPIVDVYVNVDGNLTKIIPKDVEVIDQSTVRILFTTPRTGVVRIV